MQLLTTSLTTFEPLPIYSAPPYNDQERPPLSDDVLPRIHSGDPTAVEECLDRYGGLVWSLARRHTRSSADAEDAVQEIFLAVWKNAERFNPERASEAAFITMIARRRLIDLIRRQQRRPATDGLEDGVAEAIPDPRAGTVEASAEVALAARAIRQLEPKERQAVLLSVHHGMSHGQIAEHTGMPLGTVKTYVRRGLQRVRDALEPRRGEA